MNSLKLHKPRYLQSQFLTNFRNASRTPRNFALNAHKHIMHITRKLATTRACSEGTKQTKEKRTFLSLEEAGLVEISGLDTHERFLCRLTVSSLNLMRVIAEQEGCTIEELNAGKLCDWFLKDKLKSEQNLDSAVLQWGDEFQI